MSLAAQIAALATRVATEIKAVSTAVSGKAAVMHQHGAADVTWDTFDVARIPTLPYYSIYGVPRADDARLHNVVAARAATTANIALVGAQTIDGVALAAGDVVLVKNQNTAANNGVYAVATGAWSRTVDMNLGSKIAGVMAKVTAGTQAGMWVTSHKTTDTLGSTAMVWTQVIPPTRLHRVLAVAGVYPARPIGVGYVEWVGPNAPAIGSTGAVDGDTWIATNP